MYVFLQNIGISLALLVLIIAGIYVIIVPQNFNKMLSFVNKNISDKDSIDKTANSMKNINEINSSINQHKNLFDVKIPEAIENMNKLSATLKTTTSKLIIPSRW